MTPRVLFVESDAPSFLHHRIATANGVRSAGCEVHVAAPDAEARAGIERLGFTFHPVPFSRGSTSPLAEAATLRALHALYARLAPDLAQTRLDDLERQAAIDHQQGRAELDERRVTAAAAAQGSESQRQAVALARGRSRSAVLRATLAALR